MVARRQVVQFFTSLNVVWQPCGGRCVRRVCADGSLNQVSMACSTSRSATQRHSQQCYARANYATWYTDRHCSRDDNTSYIRTTLKPVRLAHHHRMSDLNWDRWMEFGEAWRTVSEEMPGLRVYFQANGSGVVRSMYSLNICLKKGRFREKSFIS